MILDAGCGNRAMWQEKNNPDIVFIDIEKNLSNKPILFASNTALPFVSETFDTVFFDPPFKWNCDDHPFFSFPNVQMRNAMYPDIKDNRKVTGYYGIERYKTRTELVSYIYRAEKELRRVLKTDGILWVRWCNMTSMTENHLLGIFNDWRKCLTHEVNSSKQTTSDIGSFWFMLMKKPLQYNQPELFSSVPQREVCIQ
jgi:hypothetical protein